MLTMSSLRRLALMATTAVLAISTTPRSADAAGLFDFLFGGFSRPSSGYDYSPPLGVQVNPYRKSRRVLGNRPSGSEQKAKLQTAIDPVKNPQWYLDDPTLRRGDIVVLQGRALVFDGARGVRSNGDFTPIQRSSLVSQGERDKIGKSTKGNSSVVSAVEASPADPSSKGKEAALR